MVKMPFVSVIVPAYQEAGNLGAVVAGVHEAMRAAKIAHEIVVVDDGSTDGGAAEVQTSAGVRIVSHPYNLGYGASIQTGIRESKGPWIALLDADGTYNPVMLPRLLENLSNHSMAVGARPEAGGGPLLRRLARGFLRRLAQYLSGRPIPDLNSGMR